MNDLAHVAPKVVLVSALVVFPILFFVTAPYGRHFRSGWGPSIPARLAWVVMESPSVFLFAWMWSANADFGKPLVTTLGVLWLAHYVQRTFVFPALMRAGSKRKPLLTAAMAFVFNVLNASGNGAGLFERPMDLAFACGALLFVLGFAMNLHADHVLRTLRAPGESGYKIPEGGMYRFVSSPNYLGEILEWLGFAIAAQSLAGFAFFAFTFANLAPRAVSNHRWYLGKFDEYPAARRALIPFVW